MRGVDEGQKLENNDRQMGLGAGCGPKSAVATRKN